MQLLPSARWSLSPLKEGCCADYSLSLALPQYCLRILTAPGSKTDTDYTNLLLFSAESLSYLEDRKNTMSLWSRLLLINWCHVFYLHNWYLTFLRNYWFFLFCIFFFFFSAIVEQEMKKDWLFAPHYRYYVREMRIHAYSQLLESYRSLTLGYMAEAFGVSVEFIDQ